MLKAIKILSYLAIFLTLTVFGLVFYINYHAKDLISLVSTKALGVPVSVGSVHFSPFKGLFEISQLSVSNPEGFKESEALGVEKITFDMVPKSLFSSPVHIENFTIDKLRTTYEVNKSGQGNLKVLSDNLSSKASSAPSEQETSEESKSNKNNIKLVIDYFSAAETTLTVNLEAIGAQRYVETLPALTVENIGGEEGLTPEELGKEVVRVTLGDILKKAQKSYEEKVKSNLKDKLLRGVGEKFQGLMNKL